MGSIPSADHGDHEWLGDAEKAYYLSTSIEGPARSMLANLSPEDMMDFPKLVAALENRFGAKHQQQQSRVLLNTMKRKKSESLQELVENIERRVRLAYPDTTGDVQEALALHHLTTAVDERMQAELLRRKTKEAAGRTGSADDGGGHPRLQQMPAYGSRV